MVPRYPFLLAMYYPLVGYNCQSAHSGKKNAFLGPQTEAAAGQQCICTPISDLWVIKSGDPQDVAASELDFYA